MLQETEYRGPGRPKGSRNIRDAELWNRLEARGDLDPTDFLSSIVTDPKEPKELRAQAANWLLPYKYAKRQAIPSPRHIEESIAVPEFTSVEIAESFLAKITVLVARGELDFQSGLELSQMTVAWINSQNARTTLELKAMDHGAQAEQVIRIENSLPQLPGCESLIMPELNGSAINGHALAPPVPATAGTGSVAGDPDSVTTDSTPDTQGSSRLYLQMQRNCMNV